MKLKLRVGHTESIKFQVSQSQHYPVDLYYLMDLSKSMEDDKEKLSALGDLLSATMQAWTIPLTFHKNMACGLDVTRPT